jgi:uncharacterized protein YkwD
MPDVAVPESPHNERTAVLGNCSGEPACFPATELPAQEQQLLSLIIAERARAGCRPVTLNTRLIQAAQLSAGSMDSSRPSRPHVDNAQRTAQDRAEFTGYHGRVVEIIAAGLASPQRVMGLWLDGRVDPSIRARLDDCASVVMGIGTAQVHVGDTYGPGVWVVVLGQPEGAP